MQKWSMLVRIEIVIFLFMFCLAGCSSTTRTLVWKSEDITFPEHKTFDILPVLNATGRVIDEIPAFLAVYLVEEFEAKTLRVADSHLTGSEVLTVQSEILVYDVKLYKSPAPPLKNMVAVCILRTRLFQNSSENLIAEIITVNQINVGQGFFEAKNPENVVREAAVTVAEEIAKLM
jgi:hypothetical protein